MKSAYTLPNAEEMAIVAITGSLCSGKSTVLATLKAKGAKVFDADKRVHCHYRNKKSSIYKQIKAAFPSVLDRRGRILRRRLGQIVFSNYNNLRRLEKIVHPLVVKELKSWVKNSPKEGVFAAEIPLLFEKKLDKIFDAIILVCTPESILLQRIKKKLGIPNREALRRLYLYIPTEKKKKASRFVIRNNSTINHLRRKVGLIWEELKRG